MEYDASKSSSYITYLDANNLYGNSMCQPMPVNDFKWLRTSDFNLDSVFANDDTGYILQVDLEYPPELHDSHADFPLAPETQHIRYSDLSPYSQQLTKSRHYAKKLCQTLENKSDYVLYYRALELYL